MTPKANKYAADLAKGMRKDVGGGAGTRFFLLLFGGVLEEKVR
jgi:hypothetical protein